MTAVMRAADERRSASVMIISSIRLSFAGFDVDWMMNMSSPRTFSNTSTKISASLNRSTRVLTTAIVTATDVRPAVKEQVASLGAKFIAVEDEEFKQAETSGGYAKEMSDAYKQKQAALVAEHVKNQDIVITTALIPGRPAPKLISKAMIESMRPGSIIVDLAVERGGNAELAKAGEVVEHNGVRIMGKLNLPGQVPVNASSLYARNLQAFVEPLIDKESKTLAVNWDDELVKGTLIAKDGAIVNAMIAERLGGAKGGTPAPKATAKTGPKSQAKGAKP